MDKVDNLFITLLKSLKLLYLAAPVIMCTTFIIIIIDSLIPSLLVLSSKEIINLLSGVLSGESSNNQKIISVIIYWGVLFFLNNVIGIINNLLFGELSDRVVKKINIELIKKAQSLKDLTNFENSDFHDDLHILQSQAQVRPVNLLGNLALNLKKLIVIISMLIILGSIHIIIPIILLFSLLPNIGFNVKSNKSGWQATLKTSKSARLAQYFSKIVLSKEYIKESLLYNLGNYSKTNFEENNNYVLKENRKVRIKKAVITIPTTILSISGSIAILIFIVYRISTNFANIGMLVMFLQAFFQIQFHLNDLIQFSGYLQTILYYFQKMFSFLNWENSIKLGEIKTITFNNNEKALIEFENVSFLYPQSKNLVLKNISFKINLNENIAIVGENGSGKSTLIKLLLRFYDPISGKIFFNGKPIDTFDIDEWRKKIACVFQDYAKYQLPLINNITLGKRDIKHDINEINNLLNKVELNNFINNTNPENIVLGKEFGGIEPSGGQWQKIAICRALYRDSLIIVLDEPTASLDPLAEAQIFKDFQLITREKTSIMVTHRLGSTKDVDKIFVLKNGILIEEGHHESLLIKSGVYAKMYLAQQEQYQKNQLSYAVK